MLGRDGPDRGVVFRELYPNPDPATTVEVEQVHDHFEPLRFHGGRQPACGVGERIDAAQIDTHAVALIGQGPDQAEIAVAIRMQNDLTLAVGDRNAVQKIDGRCSIGLRVLGVRLFGGDVVGHHRPKDKRVGHE